MSNDNLLMAFEFVNFLIRDRLKGESNRDSTIACARSGINCLARVLGEALGKPYLCNSINRAVENEIEAVLDAEARKEMSL